MDTIRKVVLLEESEVGKTYIINMFTTGKYDSDIYSSLISQFISKTVDFKYLRKTVKFFIQDTAVQQTLSKIFYKEANSICLCTDIINKRSFLELKDYYYDILNVLKNTFIKGGLKRQKFTLTSLVNAYITLAYKVSYTLNKLNEIEDNRTEKIHEDFVNYYNLRSLDSNEQIYKFMRRIYSQINDTISIIENDFSDIALKLYLSLAIQINNIYYLNIDSYISNFVVVSD